MSLVLATAAGTHQSVFGFHVAGFARIRMVVARILANPATKQWLRE